MTAMRLKGPGRALEPDVVAVPEPSPTEALLEVLACGVCRTDLHVLDGELPDLRYPVTPGHEIVGRVVAVGSAVTDVRVGERVGVPWLARTCGTCEPCRRGLENLCERAEFTGYTVPGGYAQFVTADARYCLAIPERYSDAAAAPLLCAGLIGYRAYRAAGDARRLGLYGFGAAAHLLAQVARAEQRDVYAFTRPGDRLGQAFARRLGAVWAAGSDELPNEPLDAAIIFAAVGSLVPAALGAVRPGGRVVCAGIHMSDIPSFPYRLLWGERSVVSVANLTRVDGRDFMRLAATLELDPSVEITPLTAANEALARLKAGKLEGAAVLVPEEGTDRFSSENRSVPS
ncbi:MAG TPA: zinc-dependent alcohol dehydrogenase family protein [Gammaproteobacteria bacterium]|nr:zinc-dependent alcohol dehydrogenase family protein [Gammaproteobacteria bacterium]